jgi:hypothetical protein
LVAAGTPQGVPASFSIGGSKRGLRTLGRERQGGAVARRYHQTKHYRWRSLRQLMEMPPPTTREVHKDYRDRYEALTSLSLRRCPLCNCDGGGRNFPMHLQRCFPGYLMTVISHQSLSHLERACATTRTGQFRDLQSHLMFPRRCCCTLHSSSAPSPRHGIRRMSAPILAGLFSIPRSSAPSCNAHSCTATPCGLVQHLFSPAVRFKVCAQPLRRGRAAGLKTLFVMQCTAYSRFRARPDRAADQRGSRPRHGRGHKVRPQAEADQASGARSLETCGGRRDAARDRALLQSTTSIT